jgi:hypothetical protein
MLRFVVGNLGALMKTSLLSAAVETNGTNEREKSFRKEKLLTFLYAKYADYAATGT